MMCAGDLSRARQRVSKLLLRQGIVYCGGATWTQAHEQWLREQRFDQPGLQLAFDAGLEAMMHIEDSRDRLDTQIEVMAAQPEYAAVVARLCCLRGISTLTGFALAVEIGDWTRFTGSTIGAFVGLVPTEHSSGASRSQGPITKTGNSNVRRLLVEAAWQHRREYRTPSRGMRDRWAKAPAAAAMRGHLGNQRLHARWVAFNARHKRAVVANTAIARELAGWCWSLATLE
jgi:transposase